MRIKMRAMNLALAVAALAAPAVALADGGKPVMLIKATTFDHGAFDKLLRANVQDGKVDYAAFADSASFKAYVESLARIDTTSLGSADEKYAFWVNAYNALTIAGVLKHWPEIKSVKDPYPEFGFFKRALHRVGGKLISLDEIEHKILRASFKDYRVHAALNCASISCPPLRPEAFVAKRLNAQLDEQFKAFARDTTRNVIDTTAGTVQLSAIFDWFKDDFAAKGGVAGVLAGVLDAPQAEAVKAATEAKKVTFVNYDWSLNKK